MLNEQWNEAPITVHEGGTQTGGIGHLYLFPKSRVVLFDTGAQAAAASMHRREGTPRSRRRSQFLCGAAIDFNLWASPSADGARRSRSTSGWSAATYLMDAGVLAYRHYELLTRSRRRISASRSPRARRSTTRTLIIRKALAGGRVGFDIHGGGGYDHIREPRLAQAGAAIVLAASWSHAPAGELRHGPRNRDRVARNPSNRMVDLTCRSSKAKPTTDSAFDRRIEAGVGVAATLGHRGAAAACRISGWR